MAGRDLPLILNLLKPASAQSAYNSAMAVAVAVAISVATASAEVSTVVTSAESQMYAVELAAAQERPRSFFQAATKSDVYGEGNRPGPCHRFATSFGTYKRVKGKSHRVEEQFSTQS